VKEAGNISACHRERAGRIPNTNNGNGSGNDSHLSRSSLD
jgi:hypothetical protein